MVGRITQVKLSPGFCVEAGSYLLREDDEGVCATSVGTSGVESWTLSRLNLPTAPCLKACPIVSMTCSRSDDVDLVPETKTNLGTSPAPVFENCMRFAAERGDGCTMDSTR